MNDELRSLGNARARGIALLLVVGIAGGAAGGVADRWWTTRSERRVEGGYVTLSPDGRRVMTNARTEPERREGRDEDIPFAIRSVELTPEQVERIQALSARYRPAAESLMRSIAPRVQELNSRMQKEAMCVLTPAQRAEWMAWRERERLSLEEGKQMLELANSGRCPAEQKK